MNDDIREQIRAELEQETRRSRYRDHFSRERVHPVQHDVGCLTWFVIDRRRRQPGALVAARRLGKSVDTEALRFLVDVVRERGSHNRTIRRCCNRIEGYCDIVEAALLLKGGV